MIVAGTRNRFPPAVRMCVCFLTFPDLLEIHGYFPGVSRKITMTCDRKPIEKLAHNSCKAFRVDTIYSSSNKKEILSSLHTIHMQGGLIRVYAVCTKHLIHLLFCYATKVCYLVANFVQHLPHNRVDNNNLNMKRESLFSIRITGNK